jgi:phage portal protein BeeE
MKFLERLRRRPMEARASGAGYTAAVMAAREAWISGSSGLGELTATVQACVSLWEGGFAMAEVEGTDLLDRQTMALMARALALRGEAVFVIGDRLLPVADWEVATVGGRPRAYRLSMPEAGGGHSETRLAPEVFHVRIGSDPVAPWTGRAPLSRAALSADLLHQIETALRDTYRDAPIGSQIIHLPEGGADDMATMRAAFRGARGRSVVVEGVAQATAAGMNPNLGRGPETLTPDLQRGQVIEAQAAAREAVALAFGVLPALLNRAVTGPVVREAQRQLAAWTLQPIGGLIAEEATAKLGGAVSVDMILPLQAHDAGGRARALAGAIEAIGRAKELGLTPEEIAAAARMVNFGGGSDLA